MNFVLPNCNADFRTKLTVGFAERSFAAELMDKHLFDVQELGDGAKEKT